MEKATTTRKTRMPKSETSVKKSKEDKKKEEKEPVFKSNAEELKWLENHKGVLTPIQQMRLDFLSQPVKVYGVKSWVKKSAKPKKRKASKPAVLYDNGEYVPEPKTLTQLKSYITKYCTAMGWKDKKFTFEDCPYLKVKDIKVTSDKEKQEVYLTGAVAFQTSKQFFTKPFSRTFTLENHKEIRNLIRNTYNIVKRDWKDVTVVDGEKLLANGLSGIYDV